MPPAELRVEAGVVRGKDAAAHVTYGELTEGKRIERRLEGKAALEAASAFTIVGQSAPRRDAMDKVTGRAKFAGDIVPPGALHARILRPPAHGAALIDADTSAAESMPGVRVVRSGTLVAVLHERREEADRALALVKARFTPSPSTLDTENIFAHLEQAAPAPQTAAEGGVLAEGEGLAEHIVEDTYLDGYVAHAPMETHSAVAQFEEGRMTVWASTQTPFPLKSQIAEALRLAPEKVHVITPYVGGGFGGKSASQQAIEAARLAMIAGRPVRVVWSREEEFFLDTFHAAAVVKIAAGIDASGKITFWDYRVIGAGERGAAHFYNIADHRTIVQGGWNGQPDRLPSFRGRSVARAGLEHERVRARVAHRSAWRRRRRSIPWRSAGATWPTRA